MQRRLLLSGTSALAMTSLCGCAHPGARAAQAPRGCCVSAQGLAQIEHGRNPRYGHLSIDDPMITFSGDREFDRALGRQLVRLARTFGVNPGFAYVDDRNQLNAIASSATRVPGTWGTVLFGIRFMRSMLASPGGGDIAVLGVCAHEFGHIYQYRSGYYTRLEALHATSKLYELHADYLAGYFVGLTKALRPGIALDAFHKHFYRMGSYDARNPEFHGTPEERGQAVIEGVRSATTGLAVDGAAQRAFVYVTTHFR